MTRLNVSSISLYLQRFFFPQDQNMKGRHTFENFYTFNIFVVNCSSALFNEFITLDAKIDDFCAFYA